MKVSVIISVCDNREEFFRRSLDSWTKQTMSTKDFELIIVDDNNRKELHSLCKEYNDKYRINFQIVKINNNLCTVPITTFIPVLSNNVGFRVARGQVVCITGPETLQAERNLDVAFTFNSRMECGYGLVYKSNINFIHHISSNWGILRDKPLKELLKVPGAAANCLTRPPHPPRYHYFMAVKRDFVLSIGGYDERFGQGFCAEDDDFGNRMEMNGIKPVFEHKMLGIHQDHSETDRQSDNHVLRKTQDGIPLRQKNIKLMKENLSSNIVVANSYHIWGDKNTIVNHEIIGE